MAKYIDIAKIIEKEILGGGFELTGKLPTEYELVERFSVSRQTIRQAIAFLKSEGLVYQVQGSGTYVASSATKRTADKRRGGNVLVICTYISDYIFPSIIRGIEKELSSSGYIVNLVATGNRVETERHILQKILEGQEVDGIIVEGTKTGFPNPNVGLYERIEKMGVSVVFLHCSYPELANAIVVGMKDKEGGVIAAKTLLSKGCRTFKAIFKSDDRQGLLRYAGFCEGLLDSGIDLGCSRTKWYTTEDMDSLDLLVSKMLESDPSSPDGFICYNDQIATALVRHYEQQGRDLPVVFSFDHSYLCEAYKGKIISIGHRKDELGTLAAKKMIGMINGQEEGSEFLDWMN